MALQVMVDIETTGTDPEHSAILQIAAVKFNLDNFFVDTNFFDMCLTIPENRYWSQPTMAFWSRHMPILNNLMQRAVDYREVMKAFADWLGYKDCPPFWSKGSAFDYPFICSYFRQTGILNPFVYHQVTDLRSFLKGKLNFAELEKVPFEGNPHDALSDALHQIKVLFHHVRENSKVTG